MALQAKRLDALGSVAGAVGHEFNNLLTVALANLEPLGRGADERTMRRLTRAQDAVRRAARLTQQVLAFARRHGPGTEDADLRDVLAGLDTLLAHAAGPAVRVVLDLPNRPILARLDAGRLEVELLVLARAARAAMPDGGELRLAASEGTDGPLLLVTHAGQGATSDAATAAGAPLAFRYPRGGQVRPDGA